MAKVNFTRNKEDFEALLLGSLGFSTLFIQRRTGLTCQVNYRLGKGNVRRLDYRNGGSAVAHLMLRQAQVEAAQLVRREVSKIESDGEPAQVPKTNHPKKKGKKKGAASRNGRA